MRITSSGVVTIGDPLAAAYGGGLVVATQAGSYITVADNGSGERLHLAGQGGATTVGSKSNHDLRVITNDSEIARFDTSGNLMIGGTSGNPIGNHVSQIIANGANGLGVHRDGGVPFKAGTDADRSVIEVYKQGALVGSIGSSFGNLLIQGAGNISGLRFDTNSFTPFKNGSEANGTVDLGYANGRFKDLYLSGGVYEGYSNVGTHVKTGYNNCAFTLSCSPQNSLWRHGYIVVKVSGGSNATTGATAGLYFYEVQADLSNSYPTSLAYKGGIGDNVANFSIYLSNGVLTVADAYTTFNNIICKVEFGVYTGNVGIT
jgi:hypothetical protein